MKNSLLTIAMLLSMFSFAFGQTSFGVRAGYNLTTFGGPDAIDWGGEDVSVSWRSGFHLGGSVFLHNFSPIILEGGLYYSTKGTRYKGEEFDYGNGMGGTSDYTVVKNLSYIDIPLHARYMLNDQFSIFAGPQVSLLMSAKVKDESYGESYTYDAKHEYSTLDLSFDLGVSYQLSNGLFFQAEYDHGLVNIVTYEYSGSDGYNVKNRAFKISVGMMIPGQGNKN